MNQPFSESFSFILDKKHFQECFDESSQPTEPKDYHKAAIIGATGGILFLLKPEMWHASLFIVALSVIEFLSIRFKRAWWVWRQMMSKSANNSVKVRIDEHGITTESQYVSQQIEWDQIHSIDKKTQGILVHHSKGTSYLSFSHISDECINYLTQQTKLVSV